MAMKKTSRMLFENRKARREGKGKKVRITYWYLQKKKKKLWEMRETDEQELTKVNACSSSGREAC
jgi:hypothetical protein